MLTGSHLITSSLSVSFTFEQNWYFEKVHVAFFKVKPKIITETGKWIRLLQLLFSYTFIYFIYALAQDYYTQIIFSHSLRPKLDVTIICDPQGDLELDTCCELPVKTHSVMFPSHILFSWSETSLGGSGGSSSTCKYVEYLYYFIIYFFFNRVITLGYKKPLERDDLFELNENDSSYVVCPDFEKQWRKEILKPTKDIKVILSDTNYKVFLYREPCEYLVARLLDRLCKHMVSLLPRCPKNLCVTVHKPYLALFFCYPLLVLRLQCLDEASPRFYYLKTLSS